MPVLSEYKNTISNDKTVQNSVQIAGDPNIGLSPSPLSTPQPSTDLLKNTATSGYTSSLSAASSSVVMAVMATSSSTPNGRGLMIGLLSAFGSVAFVFLLFTFIYFLRYTTRGKILLDRIGRPGEFDDEQAFLKEEAEALENMDDLERQEYWRAKAFIEANPPDSIPTDISLSQFLAIQEKGVSAWEFEAELEIANCFVEGRTEIEFYDTECSVQSNLPVPKQNEVYYWEAKIYDKPENTLISIGMSTKPYPMFRLPGYFKHSIAYTSEGHRRHNQPFAPTVFCPAYHQGDVIGVGYRPRTGSIFFTRNGKKMDEVTHGLKNLNFFPTIGAKGSAKIHVNFGQLGFVFIEANVKKWGLAPMTGSLAPPPPYGSEAGSILLESGRAGVLEGAAGSFDPAYQRALLAQQYQQHFPPSNVPLPPPSSSQQSTQPPPSSRRSRHKSHRHTQSQPRNLPPTSPGPLRSPTEISLAHINPHQAPPEYTSGDSDEDSSDNDERTRLVGGTRTRSRRSQSGPVIRSPIPPIPSYGEVIAASQSAAGPSGSSR